MKPYIHNPAVFRAHFSGQGLPAFKGARMQRGRGWVSKLKRYAVPLLIAGAQAAAPHVSKAVSKVATSAAGQMFPNNPMMQQLAGNIAGQLTNRVIGKAAGRATAVKKQKKRKAAAGFRLSKRRKGTTLKNIFE